MRSDLGRGEIGEGQVVVLTGATSGVGRATVSEFARRGANIGLLARSADGLKGASQDVQDAGGQALAMPTDVADSTQVEEAAAAVEDRFGAIDVWVNDAMTSVFAPLADIEAEEFRRVTEVTYLGCVYGTMAALRRMAPRNRGVIVQVGSALAYRGIPLQSAYCGAKHAIQGFTESLRCELLHDRSEVRITMVQLPGSTHPSSTTSRPACPTGPSPCLRSTSPRWRPGPSYGPPTILGGGRAGWEVPRSRRC